VSFKETVVIMTSNIGSDLLLDSMVEKGEITADCEQSVMQRLRQHFRPEFLNRVDETVLFHPLSVDEAFKVAELFLHGLRQRLQAQHLDLQISSEALAHIAAQGYDVVYGARPMKRTIQQLLETPLAKILLAGDVLAGSMIAVDLEDAQLTFEVQHLNS